MNGIEGRFVRSSMLPPLLIVSKDDGKTGTRSFPASSQILWNFRCIELPRSSRRALFKRSDFNVAGERRNNSRTLLLPVNKDYNCREKVIITISPLNDVILVPSTSTAWCDCGWWAMPEAMPNGQEASWDQFFSYCSTLNLALQQLCRMSHFNLVDVMKKLDASTPK